MSFYHDSGVMSSSPPDFFAYHFKETASRAQARELSNRAERLYGEICKRHEKDRKDAELEKLTAELQELTPPNFVFSLTNCKVSDSGTGDLLLDVLPGTPAYRVIHLLRTIAGKQCLRLTAKHRAVLRGSDEVQYDVYCVPDDEQTIDVTRRLGPTFCTNENISSVSITEVPTYRDDDDTRYLNAVFTVKSMDGCVFHIWDSMWYKGTDLFTGGTVHFHTTYSGQRENGGEFVVMGTMKGSVKFVRFNNIFECPPLSNHEDLFRHLSDVNAQPGESKYVLTLLMMWTIYHNVYKGSTVFARVLEQLNGPVEITDSGGNRSTLNPGGVGVTRWNANLLPEGKLKTNCKNAAVARWTKFCYRDEVRGSRKWELEEWLKRLASNDGSPLCRPVPNLPTYLHATVFRNTCMNLPSVPYGPEAAFIQVAVAKLLKLVSLWYGTPGGIPLGPEFESAAAKINVDVKSIKGLRVPTGPDFKSAAANIGVDVKGIAGASLAGIPSGQRVVVCGIIEACKAKEGVRAFILPVVKRVVDRLQALHKLMVDYMELTQTKQRTMLGTQPFDVLSFVYGWVQRPGADDSLSMHRFERQTASYLNQHFGPDVAPFLQPLFQMIISEHSRDPRKYVSHLNPTHIYGSMLPLDQAVGAFQRRWDMLKTIACDVVGDGSNAGSLGERLERLEAAVRSAVMKQVEAAVSAATEQERDHIKRHSKFFLIGLYSRVFRKTIHSYHAGANLSGISYEDNGASVVIPDRCDRFLNMIVRKVFLGCAMAQTAYGLAEAVKQAFARCEEQIKTTEQRLETVRRMMDMCKTIIDEGVKRKADLMTKE